MTAAVPQPERDAPGDAFVEWCADDLARAAFIFARSRAEAERHHKRCVQWARAGRRIFWCKPHARDALIQRRNARIAARLSRQWIMTALHDWRPGGEGH